jgi:hypothetical protein
MCTAQKSGHTHDKSAVARASSYCSGLSRPWRCRTGADRMAGGGQESLERQAVKALLVDPAGQEARHVRVVDRASGQE